MLVVAFNFQESESKSEDSDWMEWYCRVDFTSLGQFMLVVAFKFKESESNKNTWK